MQSYFAVFEAAIEGITPNQPRGKPLTFEIAGEGNLPRVTVVKPMIRSKHGQPLLLFKKILVGRTQILPFELLNEGTLPCKVFLSLNISHLATLIGIHWQHFSYACHHGMLQL